MAKVCEICKKGPISGHRISKSNKKSLRKWRPNLQKHQIFIKNSKILTLRICTKCWRMVKNNHPTIIKTLANL